MPSRFICRSFLCVLLVTLALPASSIASMLDPDADEMGTDASAPSSSTSLKEQLDAARIAAGSPEAIAQQAPASNVAPIAPAPAMPEWAEQIIPATIVPPPVTKPPVVAPQKKVAAAQPVPPVTPVTTPAQPVDQQLVRFDSGTIATPPPASMDSLLYDNADVKANASASNGLLSGNVEPMPAAPVAHVENEMIPMAAPAKPVATQTASALPQAMPAPIPMMAPPPALDEMNVPPVTAPKTVTYHSPHLEKTVTTLPPISDTDNMPPVAKTTSAPVPAYIPAVEVRKAPSVASSSRFKPMPAKPMGDWAIRNLEPSAQGKNDAVCLLQNHFSNNLTLVIGQNGAGEGMLAIDYGIDMLSSDTDYHATVELDENFSQDFQAYAANPQRLIIKLGKNPQFFAALQSADALHIGLKGTASTFAVNNLSQGLQNFSKCVSDIGGSTLPTAMVKSSLPVAQTEMPTVPNPVVTQENITPRHTAYSPAPTPIPRNALANDTWQDATLITLKQAGFVPYNLQQSSNQMQWTNSSGTLHASARKIPVSDILDASSSLLDSAEKTCGGKFSSQMGMPETHGSNVLLQMESKCVTSNSIMVSTWLIANQGNDFTAWQMESPRDQRGEAFDARQQLLNSLAR